MGGITTFLQSAPAPGAEKNLPTRPLGETHQRALVREDHCGSP